MGLAMSYMWKYSNCSEWFISEDFWTVKEFRGISWRRMFGNHLGRGKGRVCKEEMRFVGELVILRGQGPDGEDGY